MDAFSPTWAPKLAHPGCTAHFTPGHLADGFVEATHSSYLSAMFVSWDFLDVDWDRSLRPWYMMQPRQFCLRPVVVAVIPLLGADNFDKPPNPRVANSIRLNAPVVDIYTFRDREAKAGAAHFENYRWSSRNSPIVEAIPEESAVGHASRPAHTNSSRSGNRHRRHSHHRRSGRGHARGSRSYSSSSLLTPLLFERSYFQIMGDF